MELQVLVAAMNQGDFSLVNKMNIQTNAIIANQTSQNGFCEKEYDFGSVKMISTKTVGVGLNRNIALLAAEADILLFSDDDMYYYDGAFSGIKEAFLNNPDADVIIFSTEVIKNGQIVERRYMQKRKAHIWNSMKYGTYAIAIRRESLIKFNLKFNELFGGGCPFSCGEDSLFIKDCFAHSLKIYTDSFVIGMRSKDNSTWFNGFNEKYLYDKGVLFGFLFPKLKYLLAFYYGYRLKDKTKFPVCKNIRIICNGIKGSKTLKKYSDN